MIKDLVIYGSGGFAREVLQIIHSLNAVSPTWRCVGFCVDPEFMQAEIVHGLPVHPGIGSLDQIKGLHVAVGVGAPDARSRIVTSLRRHGRTEFPVLVHPRAWVGSAVKLAPGTIVCAGASLTTDIEIDEHTHVNLNATIGHDTRIGAFTTLSPGVHISGNVQIGERVDIGTGANVIPGVTIGAGSVIGAGAAVIRDLAAGSVAVGVPAKVIRVLAEEGGQ